MNSCVEPIDIAVNQIKQITEVLWDLNHDIEERKGWTIAKYLNISNAFKNNGNSDNSFDKKALKNDSALKSIYFEWINIKFEISLK